LRATQGLLQSVFQLLNLDLPVPDYSTLCRRQKDLSVSLRTRSAALAKDLVIDSTGLKVYGEGEWKVRQHGKSKRRIWRKLHLAVNPANMQIEVAVLSSHDVSDGEVLPTYYPR
jgi:IS5 family transposase